MDPPETQVFPDVMLAFDTHKAEEFGDVLVNLNRGDAIGFNATIMTLGSSIKTRHFHVDAVWREEGFKFVPPHVHGNGRYNDKPHFLKGPSTDSTQSQGHGQGQPQANVEIGRAHV